MGLNAGDLRQRVSLQTATETLTNGQLIAVWATTASYWAKVVAIGGTEALNAGKLTPVRTFEITLRNVATITEKQRLLFGSRILNITSVAEVGERREGLKITASERIA